MTTTIEDNELDIEQQMDGSLAREKAPTCGVLVGEPPIVGTRCKDGAKCHHGCDDICWRRYRLGCVPLGASGLQDDWSAP